MGLYWKAVSVTLIALLLSQMVREKDFVLVLGMLACVMTALVLITFLEPVIEFLKSLQKLGDLQGNMLEILLKVLGIGIVTQITQTVCADAGKTSLGQALALLGTAVILWLSLPVFSTLMEIIQKVMGEI